MADIKKLRWFDIYMSNDVNVAVNSITQKVTLILDKYAPVRTIQVRTRYAPWLTEVTKQAVQKRNAAQQIAQISKDPDKVREYKNLRKSVTSMIRRDKKS